jgi:hypothetical protein
MNIVNLTPHTVNITLKNNRIISYSSSGVARIKYDVETIGELDGIPITRQKFLATVGLPEPKEGTIYIVSRTVAENNSDRSDLFIVNGKVYDDKNNCMGCTSLSPLCVS